MGANDAVPLVLGHVHQDTVTNDTGVVYQHIEPTVSLYGGVDQALSALPIGNVVVIGDSRAARFDDAGNGLFSQAEIGTAAVDSSANVVHHHLGAVLGEWARPIPRPAPVTMQTRSRHNGSMGETSSTRKGVGSSPGPRHRRSFSELVLLKHRSGASEGQFRN